MPPEDNIPTMTEDEYNAYMASDDDQQADIPTMTEDEYNAYMASDQPDDSLGFGIKASDPEPGLLGSTYVSLLKGVGDVTEGIGGAIKYLEDNTTGTRLGQSILDDVGPRQALRQAYLSQVPPDSAQWYANQVTGAAFPMASAIALRTPMRAAAGMGVTGFGQQYDRALDAGANPEDAQNSALLSGGAAALTSLPVFQAAQSTGPMLNRVLASGTVGALSSIPNTIAQYYADNIATGETQDPANLITPIRQNATVSGIMGGLAPLGFAAADRLTQKRVDTDAMRTQLEDMLLRPNEPVDTSNVINEDGASQPEAVTKPEPALLPETTTPNEPAPLPEPDSVVTVTKPVTAPNTEAESFPNPAKEPEIVLEVQKDKSRPNKPPPADDSPFAKQNSYDALEAKARELEIVPLDEAQSWFQGQVNGTDVPLVSRALSWFRKNSMPRTISKKFPQAKELYDAGRIEVEQEAKVAQGMSELLRPFYNSDNPELVNAFIGQLGEVTKQFQRERSAATKALRQQMQKATDLVNTRGKVIMQGDPEAVKQYATEIALKAQAELDALEARPVPRVGPDQMREFGLTDNDIAAVLAHREAMNFGAEQLREVFKLQGRRIKNPDTRKQYNKDVDAYIGGLLNTNYFPAIRYGQSWAATASDKEGRVIWRVDVDSMGQARKEAKAFKAKNPDAIIKMFEKPQIDQEAFPDMPSNLADAIQTFDARKWTDNAENRPPAGFTKHLIEAQKIPGYYGDLRKTTVDYTLGLAKYYGRQKAKAVLDDLVDGLPAGSALRGYAQRYSDQLIRPEAKGVKALLKFNNFMKLAGVPTSALINTTQTLTTTLPKVEGELVKAYGAAGAATHTPKVMAKVIGQTFLYLADRTGGKVGKGFNRKIAPEFFKDLDQAAKIGIFESEGLRELYNHKQKIEGRPTVADSLMFMFSTAEQFNRVIAFAAGREAGAARGLKGDALFNYAKDFVTTTQFDQTVANRPPVLSHGLPRLATQYRPFQLNYLRFLRENFNKRDYPVVALSLASMLGLGGALAIPFARDTERMAEAAGFSPIRAFRKMIGDERFADLALYGVPMDQGMSISGAVSPGEFMMSDLGPKSLAKLFGPTADWVFNQVPKAYEALKEQENPLIASEIAGPRFLRGPLKTLRARSEGGTLRNYQDSPLMEDITVPESWALTIGATPKRLQKEMELDSETFKLMERAKSKPKDYNSLIARALRNKDPQRFREILADLVQANKGRSESEQIKLHKPSIANEFLAQQNRYVGAFRRLPTKARAEYLRLLKEQGKGIDALAE